MGNNSAIWEIIPDFSLKQHNGELKGGAKASQAGRPWICACIIQGFESKSEACKFEFKWKSLSRKMTRKRKPKDDGGLHLLQHRNAALQKVKGSEDAGDASHRRALGVTCRDAFGRWGEMRKRQKM
ncbi:hypothetical protein E3N88_02158 [Mikania micrantha]|uniref:GIY-YIG domain-containing protein n=1 Tax=Mikania micrantha TaxID=192012 RepID=A0A5N6Q388_9ASTR|nr:hypothetical protein E3N88_02158 [Mikania micrantha]